MRKFLANVGSLFEIYPTESKPVLAKYVTQKPVTYETINAEIVDGLRANWEAVGGYLRYAINKEAAKSEYKQ